MGQTLRGAFRVNKLTLAFTLYSMVSFVVFQPRHHFVYVTSFSSCDSSLKEMLFSQMKKQVTDLGLNSAFTVH